MFLGAYIIAAPCKCYNQLYGNHFVTVHYYSKVWSFFSQFFFPHKLTAQFNMSWWVSTTKWVCALTSRPQLWQNEKFNSQYVMHTRCWNILVLFQSVHREREQSICLDKTNTKPKFDTTSIWHTWALLVVNSILFDSVSTVFQTFTLYKANVLFSEHWKKTKEWIGICERMGWYSITFLCDAVSFEFKLKAEGFISLLESKEKLKSILIFFSSVEK